MRIRTKAKYVNYIPIRNTFNFFFIFRFS